MRKLIVLALVGFGTAACNVPADSQPASTGAGYNREDWGDWRQQGGGCDTREFLLKQNGQNVTTGEHCKIVSGSWLSQYDLKSITVPRQVEIDHIVPVKEAWRSGAANWSKAKKSDFYNDLDNLIPVSKTSNDQKSDQDPATWLPSNKAFDCTYVIRYDNVKRKWGLTEDPAEQKAIANVKASC